MKKKLLLILVVCCCWQLNAQDFLTEIPTKKNKLQFYPTVNLLIGNPVQEFWENYSKQRLWGFNADVVFPIKRASFFQPGLQLEFYPIGKDEGEWNGMEVETSGEFIKGNLVSRFRFLNENKISPFLELGYGFNYTSTRTSYVVVDEATFFDEFFLDEEDEYSRVFAKDHQNTTQNFSIGAGIIFNQILSFQIKYNLSPGMKYVDREDVEVTSEEINYTVSKSPMQMVVISIGFSFEKAINP